MRRSVAWDVDDKANTLEIVCHEDQAIHEVSTGRNQVVVLERDATDHAITGGSQPIAVHGLAVIVADLSHAIALFSPHATVVIVR